MQAAHRRRGGRASVRELPQAVFAGKAAVARLAPHHQARVGRGERDLPLIHEARGGAARLLLGRDVPRGPDLGTEAVLHGGHAPPWRGRARRHCGVARVGGGQGGRRSCRYVVVQEASTAIAVDRGREERRRR